MIYELIRCISFNLYPQVDIHSSSLYRGYCDIIVKNLANKTNLGENGIMLLSISKFMCLVDHEVKEASLLSQAKPSQDGLYI